MAESDQERARLDALAGERPERRCAAGRATRSRSQARPSTELLGAARSIPPLVNALHQALTDTERDETTQVLLLAGAGPNFCAGADLLHLLELDERGSEPTTARSRT